MMAETHRFLKSAFVMITESCSLQHHSLSIDNIYRTLSLESTLAFALIRLQIRGSQSAKQHTRLSEAYRYSPRNTASGLTQMQKFVLVDLMQSRNYTQRGRFQRVPALYNEVTDCRFLQGAFLNRALGSDCCNVLTHSDIHPRDIRAEPC